MVKKIIKQNLRFYSKFVLLIGALITFVCSFGVSTYAWSMDSNGNLVSDNLINVPARESRYWGTTQSDISTTINNLDLGTYTISCDLTPISIDDGINVGDCYFILQLVGGQYADSGQLIVVSDFTSLNETKRGSLTFTKESYTNYEFRIWGFGNANFGGSKGIGRVSNIMLNTGSSALSYEPYGVTYYSKSNMDKITHVNFGAFAFCDSIKVRYYNSNDLTWHDYKTFNNVYEFAYEKYVIFRNQSLIIDDFKLIFIELGGNSNWRYQIYVHFPSNAIRVENYNVWAFTSANNVDLDTYAGSGYHGTNVGNLSLTGEGFSSSDNLKYIYYTRINPNIAIPTGSFGTPNSSVQYNQGYNDGYEVGKDDGFDSGFDDGKKEGIDIGYWDGYRDGEEKDFATNGFKTLIGSIFNYPINMIRSIFNFEFMGINIYSIIVFIMSIGIVIFVIRRFKK